MQDYFPALKILFAFIFGAGAGLLIYDLAALTVAGRKKARRAGLWPRRGICAALCLALACSLTAWRLQEISPLIFSFTALAFLLFHSLTDIENGHIYDLPVIMMAAAGMLLRLSGGLPALIDGALGGAAGFLLVCAVRVKSGGGMGEGDATLMLGTGTLLGWRLMLIASYCAIMAGGLFVIPMLLTKKIRGKDAVPLAPFLASGSLLSILAGEYVCLMLGTSLTWPW